MGDASAVSAAWNSATCGHLDPKTERGQLHKEIDGLMARVYKLVEKQDMDAAERITRIEEYKNLIWEKKTRVAAIKAQQRASAAQADAPQPAKLAPVQPSRSPVTVGPRALGKPQDWRAPINSKPITKPK
mmetsp:Transcript_30476/g.102800  ORF Transcript_30476/g.102800 Transcript_30476/m.102800 type:complete len:130 (-) Transcript_30476:59-448(-)